MHFITDFPESDIPGLRDGFYRHYQRGPSRNAETEVDEDDIRNRCRLLRNLPEDQAKRMLRAMYDTIDGFLNPDTYDCVITPMVDNYITDLFARIAMTRGLRHIGLAVSYFPGYTLVTSYGEANPRRNVQEREIQVLLDLLLDDTFRRDYQPMREYSFRIHVQKVMRQIIRRTLFTVWRFTRRDPLHYHWVVPRFDAIHKSFTNYPSSSYFDKDWEERVCVTGRPVVYVPLAFTPESTTDYWVRDLRMIHYETAILKACEVLAQRYCVVVKEHPHILGIREKAFYKQLRRIPNVILVPPEVKSNYVLRFASHVLVGGGSVGVEATLRRKRVYTYCDRSYWFATSGARYLDPGKMELWPEVLMTPPRGIEDPGAFLEECLRSHIPFDFFNVSTSLPGRRDDLLAFLR